MLGIGRKWKKLPSKDCLKKLRLIGISHHCKDVTCVLKTQCVRLYRGWKYRLKERYFRGYIKNQAATNRLADIPDETWKWLVYEFWSHRKQQDNPPQAYSQEDQPKGPSLDPPIQPTQDQPIYVRLYERIRKHKDGNLMRKPSTRN